VELRILQTKHNYSYRFIRMNYRTTDHIYIAQLHISNIGNSKSISYDRYTSPIKGRNEETTEK